MSKKVVVAFEGIEGSGKTFHINNVSKYLKKRKFHMSLLENLVVALILKKFEN